LFRLLPQAVTTRRALLLSAVLCSVLPCRDWRRLAPHSDFLKNLTASAVQHRLAPVAPAVLLLGFSIWLLGPLLRWAHHAFHLVRPSYPLELPAVSVQHYRTRPFWFL